LLAASVNIIYDVVNIIYDVVTMDALFLPMAALSPQESEMESRRRRGGWPKPLLQPGTLVSLSARVPAETKIWLEEGASRSGRSLMQHVDLALNRAREADQLLPRALEDLFGAGVAALVLALGFAIKGATTHAAFLSGEPPRIGEPPWLHNATAFKEARTAINELLDQLRPEGEALEIPPLAEPLAGIMPEEAAEAIKHPGANAARQIAAALVFPATEESSPTLGSWGPVIRRMLGDEAIARLEAALANAGERREEQTE
jgi:hypothetical protein